MRASLEGVRVLELARVLAGPYCGMVLADLGADVVKVESPVGDDLRGWGPPFSAEGHSTYFAAVNRNKRSVCLDLKDPGDRSALDRLLAVSDVLIENLRPGSRVRLGLAPDAVRSAHPRLVHCSITAYGEHGPLAESPGYDVVMQGFSGLMSVTGEPTGEPVRVGVAVIDIMTGVFAASGILAALVERDRTGAGQHFSTSLLETALAGMPNLTAGWLQAGAEPERLGNGHGNASPYGLFAVADGWVVLAIGNDGQWRRMVTALGCPELGSDPRYAANAQRVELRAEVGALVTELFAGRSRAQVVDALSEVDIAVGAISSVPETLAHPQVDGLGALTHPAGAPSDPPLVDSPFAPHASAHRPAPALGAHTAEVLDELEPGA